MAVYGVVFAFLSNDGRRLLAYHIISQVGYMVCGVGIGTAVAINGATAHAFAHILYKGLLFMGIGTVLYATGTAKLDHLGGLVGRMKWALVFFMVGAFSISGVPLFSGFVSKSMVIFAAEEGHLAAVVLLLNLASVGTFLSIGLKLPYFTWFSKETDIKPQPVPLNMYIGMALTSALCIAIGVYPSLLYNLLPNVPVHYQPYSATHLLETMQLLIFTFLGFWLVLDKIHMHATITLDTDWFYRRPSRFAYYAFSVSICNLFGHIERLALLAVKVTVEASTNPPGYLVQASRELRGIFTGSEDLRREPDTFNPDRYRISLGLMAFVVLLSLVILMFWYFFV